MKSKKLFKLFWLIAIVLAYVLVSHAGNTVSSDTRSHFPSWSSPVKCEGIELARNGIQIGEA